MRHSTPYLMLVGFRWQNPTGSDLIHKLTCRACSVGTSLPIRSGRM